MHGWCKKKHFEIDEACATKRKSRTFERLLKKVNIFRKKKKKISSKVKKNAWLIEEKHFGIDKACITKRKSRTFEQIKLNRWCVKDLTF